MAEPSTFLNRKMILGAGKPSAALGKAKASTSMGKPDFRKSKFFQRRMKLAGTAMDLGAAAGRLKQPSIFKKLGKRTGLGKAVLAATAVAGAYEAGKRKLFTKDKKKVQKKATGGEIIIGRGVDIDLL